MRNKSRGYPAVTVFISTIFAQRKFLSNCEFRDKLTVLFSWLVFSKVIGRGILPSTCHSEIPICQESAIFFFIPSSTNYLNLYFLKLVMKIAYPIKAPCLEVCWSGCQLSAFIQLIIFWKYSKEIGKFHSVLFT